MKKLEGCIPTITEDSRGKLILAVLGDTMLAACITRLDDSPLSLTAITDKMMNEMWATCFRDSDAKFYLVDGGVLDDQELAACGVLNRPETMEAVQTAVEMALAHWPEWGTSLRDRYTPRATIPLSMREVEA
jgi:hypothetical protein